MSFVTGPIQRRSQHVIQTRTDASTLPPIVTNSSVTLPGSFRSTTKRRRIASIGDDSATGLHIIGTHEIDSTVPSNPDELLVPITGNSLANPDFPVSYNGRGTLKFMDPIRIAAIDGDLSINGNIYANNFTEGGGGGGEGGTDSIAWDIQVGASGGANFTKNLGTTFATYNVIGDVVTLHVFYEWTNKGAVPGASTIFIKNLPFSIESQPHTAVLFTRDIIPIEIGSYFIVSGTNASQFQLLSANSSSPPYEITANDCDTTGVISFSFSYHAVIV